MYYCDGTDADQRRGGRVVTKDVYCLCYVATDIAPPDEVKRRQKSAVQNPLPVCRSCLGLHVQVPGEGNKFCEEEGIVKGKEGSVEKVASCKWKEEGRRKEEGRWKEEEA